MNVLIYQVWKLFTFYISRFTVQLNESNLRKILDNGIHKEFKLQTQMSTSSMVLFDHKGVLRRYESVNEILREFFPVRLEFYVKRKKYYEGMLEAEASKLENQARFILEKNDKKIIMENIKKKDFIQVLIQRGYDSDPVKAWKTKHNIEQDSDSNNDETESQSETSEEEKKYDYDYLIDMTMRNMLRENVQDLLKKRDSKKEELENLRRCTPQMLWEKDLDDFVEELDRVEKIEKENAGKALKPSKKIAKISSKGLKISNMDSLYKASAHAERIDPKIDYEKYVPKEKKERKKPEKAKGEKRKNKDSEEDSSSNQMKITSMMASVAALSSPNDDKSSDDSELKVMKKTQNKIKLKQSTLKFNKRVKDDTSSDNARNTEVFFSYL